MNTVAILTPVMIDKLCVNTIQSLAVDMVQKANSGDPDYGKTPDVENTARRKRNE